MRWVRAVSALLGRERIFSAVQSSLAASAVARKAFDRQIARTLSALSLPSRVDVDTLTDRLDDLEESLDDLIARVEALDAAPDALRPPTERW